SASTSSAAAFSSRSSTRRSVSSSVTGSPPFSLPPPARGPGAEPVVHGTGAAGAQAPRRTSPLRGPAAGAAAGRPAAGRSGRRAGDPREAGDEPALPGRLDGVRVVVLADVAHRLAGRHPVEHGDAGQRGPGAALAAVAGDLHPLRGGALPGLAQCGGGRRAVG